MAFDPNQSQIKIDPYQSTVPLVQMPQTQTQDTPRPASPLAGQFGRKGTGAMAMGDAILKGFLQGHKAKEERKYAQAEATIGAAQAGEQSAWKAYQEKLSSGEATKDPSDPHYAAYLEAHQRSTDTMAKFVLPEKGEKGQKGKKADSTGAKGKDDNKTGKLQSFGEKIKGFMEANPHIVPQIALLSRNPNPPGMTPQTQAQQLELQTLQRNEREASRIEGAQKTYDSGFTAFSKLDENEVNALPPEAKKQYDEWVTAKNTVVPPSKNPPYKEYASPDGKTKQWFRVDEVPAGWNATLGGNPSRPNLSQQEMSAYAKSLNKPVEQVTDEEWRAYEKRKIGDKQPAGSKTVTKSSTDENGNHISTSERTPLKAGESKPSVKNGDNRPTAVPKTQKAAASNGDNRPTAVPAKPTEKRTLTQMKRFESNDKAHQAGMVKAKTTLDKATDPVHLKGLPDDETRQKAVEKATAEYHSAMWENEKAFHKGEKMHQAKDGSGNVYGSFDGKHFFNVQTGQPYQEK